MTWIEFSKKTPEIGEYVWVWDVFCNMKGLHLFDGNLYESYPIWAKLNDPLIAF
jgi:hypothetical protein